VAILYLNTGFVLLEQGRAEDAEGVWRKGLQASGGDPSLAYNLGQLYRSRGEPRRAFEVLMTSLCRFPEDVDLYVAMGDLWAHQNSPQKAGMYFRAAARLAPDRPDIRQKAEGPGP
jgi:predicted Zn-dependent protease